MESKFKLKMRIIFILAILFCLGGIFSLIKIIAKMFGN